MKVNRPGKISIRKKFLAIGEACMAIFLPTRGFYWRTFVNSGFSTERTWGRGGGGGGGGGETSAATCPFFVRYY